jgi:hypothetical protein
MHEDLGELLVDAVITPLVGICQSASRALLDPEGVELACMCIERDVDVPQTVLLTDVGEHHARQLVPAFALPCAVITIEFVDDALELIARKQAQELGKHISFSWHGDAPDEVTAGKRFTVSESHRAVVLSGWPSADLKPKSLICG